MLDVFFDNPIMLFIFWILLVIWLFRRTSTLNTEVNAQLPLKTPIRSRKIDNHIFLNSAEDVYHYLYPLIGNSSVEYFAVLLVNSSNKLVDEILYTNDQRYSVVGPNPCELQLYAQESGTNKIFFAHNHIQEACPEPTEIDIHDTNRMIVQAQKSGIHIIDHVIVTPISWASMRQNGLLVD